MNSYWDIVPVLYQRIRELSSPEVNGGGIIFRVKHCSHNEEMFRIVIRYLVSMVDSYRLRTLSTRNINIEVPLVLH